MTSIPMTTEYVDVKVKIGAIEYTNEKLQIDSIKISNGCYDGSVFGIGNVYIKNANITMNYRAGITKGLSMEIFFEYQGEWISFGKFVVTETPVMSGDKLSVSLESEFGQTVSTSVDFTSTLQEYTLRDIKKKIEEITGKPIIFVPELTTDEEKSFLEKTACFLKNITDYVNQSGIKTGISVRDMLSGIAILFGGNVYEDTNNKIIIKQKTYYKNSNRYVPSDYLDSNYKYSQEIYAVRLVTLTFLPWCLGLFNPPNASGRICTVNYLGEDKVANTLLASQSSRDGKTPYDYTIDCDWVGWTSDGSTFDTNVTPGGRASACLRQGDLMYRTCDMTFVGIDFGWNIAPGNLVKVKVPELENPIDVLCGEISYEWDGGFTTSISCNCNIESNGSYSTQVSTQASAVAAQEGRKTSLELNYANITFSNIEDSTIRGSIFKDGTIEGSKIKDSTITGSHIADSTIKGSNIEEGTITGSKIKAATITGALIVDGTIRGNHIMESSIDGSKIEDSAITESKISNSSITNSKIKDGEIENSKIKDATLTGSKIENSTLTNDLFKDGTIENSKIKDATIENSKIKDATLTGAKIQDATIGFEKVNVSFIKDLTADKAYIENLKASIADIGYLTANEADIKYATIASLEVVDGKIDSLETIAITTNNLSAKVADLGFLKADTADLKYANIELSNIDVANVGTFFANVGLIDRATIVDGHVTGFLDSVEVNANKITAGTLVADRILLKGSENGLLYALNNLGELTSTTVDTLDGYVLTDRTINADKIVASSITTNELDVDDIFADSAVVSKIFAQNITATGVISGATLVGASISANKGTIGGFGIFDNWLAGSYEENGYQYQVEINTDKSHTDANGRTYAFYANKSKKESLNIENEWYVTYDGYMHAEVGKIAGFNFNNDGFIKESNEEEVKLICYDNLTGGGLYVSRNNTVFGSLKASGIDFSYTDTNEYESSFHLSSSEFYFADKLSEESSWRHPFEFSIGEGRDADGNYVHDPYFRVSVPAYFSTLEFSSLKCSNTIINTSSAVIDVPTTIRNALKVESDPSDAEKSYVRINNHEVQLHAMNSSVVFYLSAYSGSSNKFKLYSTTGNIVDITDKTSMTITPKITASNGIAEQGYDVIGCKVTTSGDFTCKKYRDGRLIVEYKKILTSKLPLSNTDWSGIHYAQAEYAYKYFPVGFTETPSVTSGIAIADLTCPFCTLTIEQITKSYFVRAIVWTIGDISGYELPVGTVISATFTGRWK